MTDALTGYFEAADAFFAAHATCPNRVEHLVWLPRGLATASVTLTCACGGRAVIPCSRIEARALVAAFRAGGYAVRTFDGPERPQ